MSRLIQALKGEKQSNPPVWFMRQAGRYLPEYRAIREKYSMLDVIRTPELATEVTLQPLRRFELDGAIIFADILNPLIGMGIELDFVVGEGPKIFNVIKSREDINRLIVPPVDDNVGYTLQAIKNVSSELQTKKIPLLGFAGAPFTLSSYMLGEEHRDNLATTKRFMYSNFDSWCLLQDKLSKMVTDYLVAQIDAGASAVQLFDTWAGALGPIDYDRFVFPWVNSIINEFKTRCSAPIIYFATGARGLFHTFNQLNADCFGVDFRSSLTDVATEFPELVLQGNIDPVLFTIDDDKALSTAVNAVLKGGEHAKSHIFNVGHGLLPQTRIESISKTIELIKA